MIEMAPLNETTLARETLSHLCDPKNALSRAAHVLELVGRSSIGLGEVIQDFAAQGYMQLGDVIRAASAASRGAPGQPDDVETLRNIHYTLKSVKSVLEMIPAAMQRNKSDALGEKEQLTRADIVEITHVFLHMPDIMRLLGDENSGNALAVLVTVPEGSIASGLPQQMLAVASH